jgi:hypothetical protein
VTSLSAQRTPGLGPNEWAILRRVIDLIQANAKGAELGTMLETIGNALRADQSKLIGQESGPPEANHPDGAPYRTAWMSTLTAADPIQRPDARAVLFKGGINGSAESGAAERAITTTPALPTAAGLGVDRG